ncbi:IclR family transcriptional regulator [Streptomyces vinaceus]|uniref:IclR family transcriptional regulator n=1 Tax=Streptomyces vinaceus TaxID=1960 RepID=UPI0036986CAB
MSAVRSSMAGSSALEKTLRIIEELSAPGGPHRLAEVAAASGVPKSSTYRILASLVEQGYAVTDGEGSYGIGLRLRSVAAGVCAERPGGISELLEFLHRGTGHAVHLALRHGAALTYIREAGSGRPFRSPARLGMSAALHSTAIGRSVLAHLPPQEAQALCRAAGAPAYAPGELGAVREHGYALDDAEDGGAGAGAGSGSGSPAVRCLAAPVFGHDGAPVGGISLTAAAALTTRAELERFSPALLEAARGVELLLRRG